MPSHFADNGILKQTGRAVSLCPTSVEGPGSASVVCNHEHDSKAGQRSSSQSSSSVPSPLWASGFSFSDSSLLVEVPYDPRLPYLFFGEEISMAARYFLFHLHSNWFLHLLAGFFRGANLNNHDCSLPLYSKVVYTWL